MMEVDAEPRAWQPLPKGFRFHPTDEEVVDHFLRWRNLGHRFSPGVPDINHTKLDPWELPVKFEDELKYQGKDKNWWFFSSRTRNQVTARLTDSGRWKNNSEYNDVMGGDESQMRGIRIDFSFLYRQGGRYERFINWKFYEYRLTDGCLDGLLPPDQRRQRRRTAESVEAPFQHVNQERYLQASCQLQSSDVPFGVLQSVEPSCLGGSSGSGSNGCVDSNRDIPSNSLEYQAALFLDGEQWQTELFLRSVEPSQTHGLLQAGRLPGDASSSSQHNTYLLGSRRAQSAQSLSGFVPADEKKTSTEIRNARPRPSSPSSAVFTLQAESTGANPHWKKKIEEDKELAQQTKQMLRLQSGSISTSQNQNSLSPQWKYLFNVAVGLVMMILICSQMLNAGIILLVWMLLILFLMKPK